MSTNKTIISQGTIRKVSALCCFLVFNFCIKAQDAVYSQFYNAPLQLNPALTGMSFNGRIGLNYRNQWPGFGNAYITYTAAYDRFIEKANSGVGISIMSDNMGDGIYRNVHAMGHYAYNVMIDDKWSMRGGVQAGIVNSRLDWNRLVFPDQLNPLSGPVDASGLPNPTQQPGPQYNSRTYFDVGAGIMAYSDKLYGGASIFHINSPEAGYLRDATKRGQMPLRYSFQLGGEFIINPNNKVRKSPFISPNVLFTKQGEFFQFNLGSYVGYGSVFGGAWFRYTNSNADALIFSAGVRTGIWKIAYSYDHTISGLNNGRTIGSHEIGVIVNFDESPNAKKSRMGRRYENCFKMFQ